MNWVVNFKVAGVNEIDDISVKGEQSEPQPYDAVGTAISLSPSQSAPPRLSSSRPALVGFLLSHR